MAQILDGKKVAEGIKERLKEAISRFSLKPCLVIIQIGEDKRSEVYIRNKKRFAEAIGVIINHEILPENISQEEVESKIRGLNEDNNVHGIIVQLPISKHLNKETLVRMVDPTKDVDGLSSDDPIHTPATARGITSLLKVYGVTLNGKKVVVIGKSRLVGAPTARILRSLGAHVTTCDKSTEDIPAITKAADIVVVAAGSPRLVTKEYVSKGQVIIDVGINPVTGEGDLVSHTVGDVDFPEVSEVVGAISPVPGGVGPLTVASLFENLLDAFQLCVHSR